MTLTLRGIIGSMNTFDRRHFLCGLMACSIDSRFMGASIKQHQRVYIGTYTEHGSQGVYAYRWTPELGILSEKILAATTPSPSFLTLSPERKELFAVNELATYQGEKSGSVSAFSIDRDSGKLSAKNVVPSGGTGPCNVAADHTGRVLFVANYFSGSVASFQILHSGELTKAVTNIYFPGHSVDEKRQGHAYTHCTTVSPDNRYLLVSDLGLDRIMVYRFSTSTAVLTANDPPFYMAIPGSGPRNFAFHPNGRWAYSANELGGTVDGLDWNSVNGTLTRFQNISTTPKSYKGPNAPGQVNVHPNGRFVYISNRGHDSIAAFSVDRRNGSLTNLQYIPCGGKFPRHFAIDPSGRWLIVANKNSANIVVLSCDPHTGKLAATKQKYELDSPACVVFE